LTATGATTGRYLVVFKSDTLPSSAAATVKAAGGKVDRALSPIGVVSVSAGAGFAAAVAKDSSVLAVGHAAYKVFDRYRYTDEKGLHDTVGAFDGALFDAIVDAAAIHIPVVSDLHDHQAFGHGMVNADIVLR
jgi:phage tail tape-measure protein